MFVASRYLLGKGKFTLGLLILFPLFFALGCTDYAAQMEDEYGEIFDLNVNSNNNSYNAYSSNSFSYDVVASSSAAKQSSNSENIAFSSTNYGNDDACSEYNATTNTLTDIRDNQIYRTVTIGNQTWMAENLKYETYDGTCYDDIIGNCETYGVLYPLTTAMNICPGGWHLPSRGEWNDLFSSAELASNLLEDGLNSAHFSAILAGSSNGNLGVYAIFWTSESGGYSARIDNSSTGVYVAADGEKINVRCVLDEISCSTIVYSSSSSILYQSSSTTVYQSSSSVSTVAVCNGSSYDTATSFCNDGVVTSYCKTSCYSPDYSQCSSCLTGNKCNGVPYNSKYFGCVSGVLHPKCGVAYYGDWFSEKNNSCI